MDERDSHSTKAIESVARFGYVAKGVIYFAIGGLAALAAAGRGGETTDTQGALREIASQPFGQVLLVALAVGLAGHVIWRLVQAWADPEHRGTDAEGLMTRLGFVVSALVYAALTVYTLDLLLTAFSTGSGDSSPEDRTAQAMSLPGGVWLVGLAGVVFIGVALYHLRRGYRQKFLNRWDLNTMSESQARWACRIASTGLIARGIVFFIIGGLLIVAAWRADPSEAEGLGGALQKLAEQPFGVFLLGIVAAGLACYGIYCFINARYRHVNP